MLITPTHYFICVRKTLFDLQLSESNRRVNIFFAFIITNDSQFI